MSWTGVPPTRYAHAEGARIAFQVFGDGDLDLVLVLPWLSQIEHLWEEPGVRALLEELAQIGRIIVFDRRGAGLSDPVAAPPTLEQRIDDLLGVLDAAGSAQPAILAQQEGGTMAVLFAATHPERVRALVLYGAYAAGNSSEGIWWVPDPKGLEAVVEFVGDHWGEGLLLGGLAPSRLEDQRFAEWLAKLERLAASPTTAQMLMRIMSETDVKAVLPSIRVPTLVLHRSGDTVIDVRHGRYLAANISGARFVELRGNDHLPSVGDTAALLDEIAQFITGAPYRGRDDRSLATVLFTDMVGSTDRAAELGDESWRKLLDRHDETVRHYLTACRGREIGTTGDGFLAIFDGPGRALECARRVRESLRQLDVTVRAGLHTGEIELRGDDVAGIAVHIAARVTALARPGEILVSSTVKDLVVGSRLSFDGRGEHHLKGVPGSWQLYALAS